MSPLVRKVVPKGEPGEVVSGKTGAGEEIKKDMNLLRARGAGKFC